MKNLMISISAFSGEPPKKLATAVEEAIRGLIRCSKVFFVGGYVGLMKVAVDSIIAGGAVPVLILPIEYEAEHYPKGVIPVKTGMSYRGRNVVLVRSGDVLVAFGGGPGTIMEIITAYSEGRPVYLLVGHGMPSDALAKAFPEGRIGDGPQLIFYYNDPNKLAKDVCMETGEISCRS